MTWTIPPWKKFPPVAHPSMLSKLYKGLLLFYHSCPRLHSSVHPTPPDSDKIPKGPGEREAWLERIVSKKAGEIMPPSPLFSHPWHRKEIVKTVCMYVQRKWLLFYSSFTNPCIKKSPYYQYTNSHSAVVLFLSVCVCVPSTPYSFPTDFRVVYYILTSHYSVYWNQKM